MQTYENLICGLSERKICEQSGFLWPPVPHNLPPKFSFQDFFKTILCFAKTFGLFPDTRPHLIYNPKKESLLGNSSKDCLKMPLYGFVSFLLMQSLSGISVSWPRVEHAIAQWASVSIVAFTYILLLFGCMLAHCLVCFAHLPVTGFPLTQHGFSPSKQRANHEDHVCLCVCQGRHLSFSDAKASPSTYPCQSVSGSLIVADWRSLSHLPSLPAC